MNESATKEKTKNNLNIFIPFNIIMLLVCSYMLLAILPLFLKTGVRNRTDRQIRV